MPRSPMPKTIRLAGRRVRLVVEKSATLNLSIQGLHQEHANKITLDSELAPDQMRAVTLHEIVHDLDALVGTGLDEQAVTSLASVLFAALRDNPALVKWLME